MLFDNFLCQRIDALDAKAVAVAQRLLNKDTLWANAAIVCPLHDIAENVLVKRNCRCCYPGHIDDEDTPCFKEECEHCMYQSGNAETETEEEDPFKAYLIEMSGDKNFVPDDDTVEELKQRAGTFLKENRCESECH